MARTWAALQLLRLLTGALALATDASEPAPLSDSVCDAAAVAGLPFCDSSLPIDARVADLLGRIPLQDAVGLLADNSSAVASLDLRRYPWWNEALHGVAWSPGVQFAPPTSVATSFPQAISTAASFNRSLFHRIGDAVATEARAFYNAKHAGLSFWTPNVNILRDPRWGRGQETPGEDPFLTGEYAVAMVRGLQGEAMEGDTSRLEPEPPGFLKLSACCKHLSAYSQEVPRHRHDAIVTRQDQADTYLPAFEACVTRGRVSGIMCSYNAVNGVPSCADRSLLTDLARGQWKFDGYVTSDCGAVADVLYAHHYTQTPERTCATTLAAGMDLNCGEFLREHLAGALEQGVVSKRAVYAAVGRLFRVQMRLGMFEKGGQPFRDITPDRIDSPAHRQLALEAARQGIVLLKNDESALPLNASVFAAGSGASLALIGPHFNASEALLGDYFGPPSSISTPLHAIAKAAANVTYALGCHVAGDALPDFDEAVALTSAAHRVVAFVGLDLGQEHEGIDRTHLKLPGFQHALLERLMSAARRPIVIVVLTGGAVDLSAYKDHPKVGAIVLGGYLGQSGGQAISDVLFGVHNPSGRLPQTLYAEEFARSVSIYDMNMRPTVATGNPGRTYRFFTGAPVYEFGHGLSYSTFTETWGAPPARSVLQALPTWRERLQDHQTCAVELNVSVTNEGGREGQHSVLCFAEPPRAGTGGRPLKSLVAFQLTPLLAVKQQSALKLCLPPKAFALAGADGEWAVVQGTWVLHVGDLRHEVQVRADSGAVWAATAIE